MPMQISLVDFHYNLRLMMIWIKMSCDQDDVFASMTDELPITAGERF